MKRGIAVISLSLLLGLLGSACDEAGVRIQDDLDFELFSALLHTPYVVGAEVRISAWHDNEDRDISAWTFQSADPSIFPIDDQTAHPVERLRLTARALAPGETVLTLLDGGASLARRTIRVAQPDEIQLIPAGLIKVQGDDADPVPANQPIRILDGGLATFEIIYRRDGERLFGNGAVTVTSSDPTALQAYSDETFLFENREWLRLRPRGAGVHTVTLAVGGQTVASFDVESVAEGEVDVVELLAEPSRRSEDEDLLYVLARAYDASDQDIWGISFSWAVDGWPQSGEGDLFYYYYDAAASAVVTADFGTESDAVTVHASDWGITNSNFIGCATGGAGAALPSLVLGLLGFLALGRRRRQQRRHWR